MSSQIRTLLSVSVAVALPMIPVDAVAQRSSLFEGIRVLNRAESTFGPEGDFESRIRYYEDRGDGVIHATFEGTDAAGDSTFTQYAAEHDGLPYPMVVEDGTLRQSITFTPIATFASDGIGVPKRGPSGGRST